MNLPSDGKDTKLCVSTPHGLVTYHLQKSRRKTIMIRIEDNLQVRVAAPWQVRLSEVERFLLKKSHWLFRKLIELQNRPRFFPNQVYADKQEYLFLGERCRLNLEESEGEGTSLSFDGKAWKVLVPKDLSEKIRNDQIRERLMIWYSRQAKDLFPRRVEYFSQLMNTQPREIVIKAPKSLWGSCDYRKQRIQLNWQLIMTPLAVLDYVVVHELAHLTHPNHSRRFWQKVEKFFPQYQDCRKWLKVHQREITSLP